jgi:hypothetical protein
MKAWLKIVAFLAFAGALTAAGTYAWVRYPTFFRYNLKLATGPVGSDGQKLIAAFNRELAAEHPLVRMVPVATDTLAANGKALAAGEVHLAVLRSDDVAAAQGRTLFVLRRMSPPPSSLALSGSLMR